MPCDRGAYTKALSSEEACKLWGLKYTAHNMKVNVLAIVAGACPPPILPPVVCRMGFLFFRNESITVGRLGKLADFRRMVCVKIKLC